MDLGALNFSDNFLNSTFMFNDSSLTTDGFEYSSKWRATTVIYLLVLLFGFFENATITGFLLKKKRLLKRTNIFILALAMSDVFLCVFSVPFRFHTEVTGQFALGKTMCKISPLFHVPLSMSSLTILVIAIHRYSVTAHALHRQFSIVTSVCLVIGAAVFSILIEIPTIIRTEYITVNDIQESFCVENWTNVKHYRLYFFFAAAVRLLPLLAAGSIFICIGRTLYHGKLAKLEKQKKQEANYILMAIPVVCFVCRLPEIVYVLILDNDRTIEPIPLIWNIVAILAIVTACINPFLYAWLNNFFDLHLARRSVENRESSHAQIQE